MLRIHQPYIKKQKVKYLFVLASMGAFLLGSLVVSGTFSESSVVQAAEIKYMQQFTNPICESMSKGGTMGLIDPRGEDKEDFQTYQVTKMQDGTCWMAENLRLKANTPITPDDSDVKSNWTLPKNSSVSSSNMDWGTDYNTAYMAEGSTSMKLYSGSGAWKEAYGNYYSWCAATAMSCLTNRTGAALNNTDAAESICPKGWKLPVGTTGAQSFQNLYSQYPNSTTAGWMTNQTISYNGSTSAGYNGLKLGFNSVDAFFPAAGNVYTSYGLDDASSDGYYWSRRAYSNTVNAYYLYFNSGTVNPQRSSGRSYGYSVRCVADPTITSSDFTYEGDILWEESLDSTVNVNVPSILTIDATSGMDEIADASKVIEGTATATISSNTEYTVTLQSSQPPLKDIDNSTNTSEISPVSSTNPVQPGNNSWGLWNGSGNANSKTYTLPLTTTPQEFYNTTASSITDKGNTTTHTYYVGISISPALSSGTYGTNVTITASVK